jgi:hypothetical protein
MDSGVHIICIKAPQSPASKSLIHTLIHSNFPSNLPNKPTPNIQHAFLTHLRSPYCLLPRQRQHQPRQTKRPGLHRLGRRQRSLQIHRDRSCKHQPMRDQIYPIQRLHLLRTFHVHMSLNATDELLSSRDVEAASLRFITTTAALMRYVMCWVCKLTVRFADEN